MKKSHSKLSNNEPVSMYKEGWCVRLGQEGVICVRVGGNIWNTLNRGRIP